jgi:polyphenol oxidase
VIRPDWPAPANVRAVMTTRNTGDAELAALLPGAPVWLRQVHGTAVAHLDTPVPGAEADAAVTRTRNRVCAIRVADCMPVLFADDDGRVIGAAHAGWRGLCAGVLENTMRAMQTPPAKTMAWLGPAIGPKAYEVGDEVRAAFLARDRAAAVAFSPARPGHWLLDLYAVARQRLRGCGIERVSGGSYCTYLESERFHSYRRDRTSARMAALLWLAE